MLGILEYVPVKGHVSVTPEYIAGLPLLRGTLSVPEGWGPWRRQRRVRRLKRLLTSGGVRRLVIPEGSPWAEEFEEFARVDPLPFYRDLADLLAIESLRRCGLEPRRAVVALSAPRLCRELTAAAERLCPQVRGLVIDVPEEGARYAGELQRRCGLPVTPPVGADLTVSFGPGGGRWGRVLELSEMRMELCGMEVSAPSLALPRGCERQLLAALWEYGVLGREKLRFGPVAGRTS